MVNNGQQWLIHYDIRVSRVGYPKLAGFGWLVKQCLKPPMTGNGKHASYKHDDFGVYDIVLPTI